MKTETLTLPSSRMEEKNRWHIDAIQIKVEANRDSAVILLKISSTEDNKR